MGMMMFMVGQAYAQEPTCKTNYGETACGYNCIANYGEVKCSRTPQGACQADYGQVVCWDPPRWVDQKAECLANYGEVVCGYNCVANYGVVKCAQTPNGICRAENGDVRCYDL